LHPQQAGVKKRLIKLYQSVKAKKWQTRWVLHPNSTSDINTQQSDVWLKKWVSRGQISPLVEMNAEGMKEEDIETLKRLNSIEECEYADNFYDFDDYLNRFQTYICEVNGCQKIYFDQRLFKIHQIQKHGIIDNGGEKKEQPNLSHLAINPPLTPSN
jgi:hypothetical protein